MSRAVILGTGSCLPGRVLTNARLEQMVETSDAWIKSRTGISERHIAGAGEELHKIAAQAGRRALEAAHLSPADLDLIVLATISPYMIMPATACFVQAELGAVNAFAYDISAACAGFIYGMDLAGKYIGVRPDMKVLVIGAENLSTRVNWQDRNTCVLFGDGAGAAVLTGTEGERGILDARLHADGRFWHLLYTEAPASMNKELQPSNWKGPFIQMNGAELFRHAVRLMAGAVRELLDAQHLDIADIALVIPHQANIRIINNLRERLALPEDKIFTNLDRYGNTSSASIPIAMDEACRGGRLRSGDLVLLCTFGAGLAWGALLLRW